uniref:Uncharacterized protein n=1 Tax=viral metagenome TaxID=1070528 RepID=A0A6C0H4Y9_9ZZZZ
MELIIYPDQKMDLSKIKFGHFIFNKIETSDPILFELPSIECAINTDFIKSVNLNIAYGPIILYNNTDKNVVVNLIENHNDKDVYYFFNNIRLLIKEENYYVFDYRKINKIKNSISSINLTGKSVLSFTKTEFDKKIGISNLQILSKKYDGANIKVYNNECQKMDIPLEKTYETIVFKNPLELELGTTTLRLSDIDYSNNTILFDYVELE